MWMNCLFPIVNPGGVRPQKPIVVPIGDEPCPSSLFSLEFPLLMLVSHLVDLSQAAPQRVSL